MINFPRELMKCFIVVILHSLWWVRSLHIHFITVRGFPDSSVGKESTWNAGDHSLIPGSGRSPGEGIGYPLQYSWASLVAQLAKNLPAMWETWVQSLDWEDPLEKGKATHSRILAWRIPWTIQPMRSQSRTRLSDFHFHFFFPVFLLGGVHGVTESDTTEQLSVYVCERGLEWRAHMREKISAC